VIFHDLRGKYLSRDSSLSNCDKAYFVQSLLRYECKYLEGYLVPGPHGKRGG
jgi:hypothetical protein